MHYVLGVDNNDGATGPRKKSDGIFGRLDTIHEGDRRTDTGRQQRQRLRIASRGKKHSRLSASAVAKVKY